MTRERVRDRDESLNDEAERSAALNGGSIDDPESARENLMGRFEAGESVIQPPGESGESLGESIRKNLRKLR